MIARGPVRPCPGPGDCDINRTVTTAREPALKKLIMLALLLSLAATAAAQTVYRWVDADGVVHFGTQPPRGVDATLVDTASHSGGLGVSAEEIRGGGNETTTAGEAPLSYAEQRRRDRAERHAAAREEQSERQSKCANMQRQRAALEPSPRVIIEDENGNPVRMADEDRLAKLEEAKKYLSENCQ